MRILSSIRWRLFLTAWILYSAHFATNIVREHYTAFALVDHFSLKVDDWEGFHSDIFVHSDGHSYVGNNVAVGVVAAIPLLIADPALDALEDIEKRGLAEGDTPYTEYRTFDHHPNRKAFFRMVKERGLALRFGAAAAVTTVFLQGPLSALCVVLLFHILTLRGAEERKATWLALVFAFGTPLFFRTSSLTHNLFLMYASFLAFYLLWRRPGESPPASARSRFVAGLLIGFTLAADYIGVIIIAVFYGYLLVSRLSSTSWKQSFRESLVFVAGTIPPVLFLLYSQWAMFGNPFLPGQYWMPDVNYTDLGWRGFSFPTPDLYFLNLFSPTYGMYVFGPLLILGLIPARWYDASTLILPLRERRFVAVFFFAMLTFCAANQYSRMQFNTGFRYLMPLVPFIYLALSDHLVRMPKKLLVAVAGLVVLHSWVITAFRESVPFSWRLFLENGIQLPWLTVLRLTSPDSSAGISHALLPTALLLLTLGIVAAVWRLGERAERRLSDRAV